MPASTETSKPRAADPRDRVIAVVTAFLPTSELLHNCAALAQQVTQVIVVDDGSGQQAEPVLRQLEAARVIVIRQEQNAGIAAAVNRGFAVAREAGAEFVVTFDQDSQVPEGFVAALIDTHDRAVAQGIAVGMVAPEFFSQTPQTVRPERAAQPSPEAAPVEARAPIQSGLLMPLAVVQQIGPQREDYFIDLVDTEYYLRAQRAGFSAICAPGLRLPHGFGHKLYLYVFGRRIHRTDGRPSMIALSTPFRYYYRARNRVVLQREYGWGTLRRDALRELMYDYALALWSVRGKFALFSLMCAGWIDGLRGRMGIIPSRLDRRARRVTWKHPA